MMIHSTCTPSLVCNIRYRMSWWATGTAGSPACMMPCRTTHLMLQKCYLERHRGISGQQTRQIKHVAAKATRLLSVTIEALASGRGLTKMS